MKIGIIAICVLVSTALISRNQNQRNLLVVGQEGPDFSLTSENKGNISLKEFLGQSVVIYFFPKADTPGWTKQACGFRNIYQEYEREKIIVLGISYDSPKSLRAFKEKHKLPFHLLSDKDKHVSRLYGANGLLWLKRITFIINPNGIIEKIYTGMNLNSHAEEILDYIVKERNLAPIGN